MRSNVIAAISTPPGKGGVAIIRISGEGAHGVADAAFKPRSGRALTEHSLRSAVYGRVINGRGETVDDGIAILYPAGSSYTGEDTAEICCHGGVLVTRAVLTAVFEAGAVPAEAGEFTRRAFVNGRLTLTEAEAIGGLLEAGTEEQLRLYSDDARSRLREAISSVADAMTKLLGSIYSRIDYPDEDLGEFTDGQISEELGKIARKLDALIDSYRCGRVIAEGVTVALVGSPNAGKSSLYNALLGQQRAIVTDVPGTTRDILETVTPMGKATVRLIDTAGVRCGEGVDRVEKIGIELTERAIRSSELLLAVYDISRPLSEDDGLLTELLRGTDRPVICILNKCDGDHVISRDALPDIFADVLTLSAKDDPTGASRAISHAVESLLLEREITPGAEPIVSSARQHAALTKARKSIGAAMEAHAGGLYADLTSSEIELALGAVLELDGRSVSEAVVGDIFSRFCVGK